MKSCFSYAFSSSILKLSLRKFLYCRWIATLGFRFGTVKLSLWKSNSKISVFWKLREQFVSIRSMHVGLFGFLKQVLCLTRFFKLYRFKNSAIFSSSTLKFPSRIRLSWVALSFSSLANVFQMVCDITFMWIVRTAKKPFFLS